ncbi:MAG: TRAP transporter small permease [Alphaproteobacteria bacterium]|nr:TRAP transporter small permease [Alphaproteobacteria bacterium]
MTSLIDTIEAWLARIETLFLRLANYCLAAMLVTNMVNILIRAVSDRGLLWVFPWTQVLFIWCSFIGLFVVYRRGTDITVDYFHDRVGAGGKLAMRIFADLVMILVLVGLLVVAPQVLETQKGDIELTGLSRWMLSVPLFISSFLVAVDVALDLARVAAGLPSRPRGHGAVL